MAKWNRPDEVFGLAPEAPKPSAIPFLPKGIQPISFGAPDPARFGNLAGIERQSSGSVLPANTFGSHRSATASVHWQSQRAELLEKMREREDRSERYGLEGEARPTDYGFAKPGGPIPFATSSLRGSDYDEQERKNESLRALFGVKDDNKEKEEATYGLQGAGFGLAAASHDEHYDADKQGASLRKLFGVKTPEEQQGAADSAKKLADATKLQSQQEEEAKNRKEALTLAIKNELDEEQKRLDAIDKETQKRREQLREANQTADAFTTIGQAFARLIRGDIVGAMQAGTGFLQRRTYESMLGGDQKTAQQRADLAERRNALKAGDLSGASPGTGIPTSAMPSATPTAGASPKGLPKAELLPEAKPTATASPIPGASPKGLPMAQILPQAPPAASAAAGAGAAEAAGSIGGLATGLAAVAGPAAAAAGAIATVGQAMISLASKASPAAYERYQIALDDTAAVMGRVFVPVLELATEGVRTLADVLAEILPSSNEMREALAPVKDAFKDIRDAIAPLIPMIKGFVTGLTLTVGWLAKVVVWTQTWPLAIAKALGLIEAGAGEAFKGRSLGASAQPAQFMDVNSYLRQQYEKAASMGAETAPTTEGWLEKIFVLLTEWYNGAKNAPKEFTEGFKGGFGHAFGNPLDALGILLNQTIGLGGM